MPLVQQTIQDGVAYLTLNDPERRNPLSDGVRRQLIGALESISQAAHLHAVVISGAAGNFCSGGDLSAMPPMSVKAADDRLAEVATLVRLLRNMKIVTIAAVDGIAAGIGVGIAAICDFVIVSDRARFLLPFSRLGLLPDGGSLGSIAQRVGTAQARKLFLEADPVRAEAAVLLGLADECVPFEQLANRSAEIALAQGKRAAATVREVKSFYSQGDISIEAALQAEARAQPSMYFSTDFLEAKEAFFQKREPKFERSNH